MAWLPATSTTVEPARSDMARWAGGGIMWSSVATRYQLGFVRHAGSLTMPPSASTPHGTCESARNSACEVGRSPANEAWNLSRSRKRNPLVGGRMGGTGDPGGGSAMRVLTDSPLSGAKAAMYTRLVTRGWFPAWL